ncbi:YdcF family protein [Chitinophaga sp. 22321]|uniref:YdcF family protein n=1 Tax=Chitinophaga hostae TaxID=2831022 RepID=A0ABS5J7B3_9BACT|nr:YdcF family protein [Chitinophaga hostae]MBS0031098.1 YdcF family protein [Chitinophaga hostae]
MKGLILSLGAPNDIAGNLSTMALDRLNAVLQIYRYNPQFVISCTGGKGEHFNEAAHPHYHYAQQYLLANGIPETALAEPVNSASTIDDFVQARPLIYRMAPELLWVVTSDFHVARAKIIQQERINYAATIFWGAPSTVPAEQLASLFAHEQKAIARLQQGQ